jgi:hypothetical protein
MLIPVFVSCPSKLNPDQERSREVILQELQNFDLEPRAVGRSDYPTEFPLREVLVLGRHCSGGLILGFEQFRADSGTWKPGTAKAMPSHESASFPSAWNHLEAGMLFSLGLPLLVFREANISGGIFDNGVSDAFIQAMPPPDCTKDVQDSLRQVFGRWQARVRQHYYAV